jgi:hypothetical protein
MQVSAHDGPPLLVTKPLITATVPSKMSFARPDEGQTGVEWNSVMAR